jgi:Rv0078B-related antitoxin
MSDSPDPIMDEIYREKIERARAMSPWEKILAGEELFELACDMARAGIRSQFPDLSEEEVQQKLYERIELLRELERRR